MFENPKKNLKFFYRLQFKNLGKINFVQIA